MVGGYEGVKGVKNLSGLDYEGLINWLLNKYVLSGENVYLSYSGVKIEAELNAVLLKYLPDPSIPGHDENAMTNYCDKILLKKVKKLKVVKDERVIKIGENWCDLVGKDVGKVGLECVDFVNINHPFKEVIKDLQSQRRKFKKGTLLEALMKLVLNAIYGLIVQGMGDKRKFDIRSGRTERVLGTELSNPIIAG